MFNAKTIEDFLSKDMCLLVIDSAIKSDLWENAGSSFWDNRAINYYKIKEYNKEIAAIILDANNRCRDFIIKEYNLNRPIYSDTLQIIRWFPGLSQPPHADDMTNTEIAGFDHRVFGSILYLNDDYSGGHTYYPNFNYDITPKTGKLAVHPGDPEHLHGVTEIKDSVRYTIASFWTFDRSRAGEWSIY